MFFCCLFLILCSRRKEKTSLNTSRHPDVLELGGVVEELEGSALSGIGPITGLTVVDKSALEVAARELLNVVASDGRSKVPDGIDVHVLGEHLDERITVSSDDVDHSTWDVRRLKDLVEVGGGQRSRLRGDDDHGVSSDDGGGKEGDKAKKGLLIRTGDTKHSDGLSDADGGSVERCLLDVSSVLVGEGGPVEQSLDRLCHFLSGLLDRLPSLLGDPLRKLLESGIKVLSNIVEDLPQTQSQVSP